MFSSKCVTNISLPMTAMRKESAWLFWCHPLIYMLSGSYATPISILIGSVSARQTVHIEQGTRSHRNQQADHIETGKLFTSTPGTRSHRLAWTGWSQQAVKFAKNRCRVFKRWKTLILLRFRASCIIGRVFTGWVFIGCSRHFEHRVFTGVFMGVHGSAGVQECLVVTAIRYWFWSWIHTFIYFSGWSGP